MSRLVKIVNNKYVQIEEYKNPNICFNTNEYDNFEDYCILRETFDPFEIFYENQELKKQLEENKDKINWYENFEINKTIDKLRIKHNNQQQEFIEYLENEIYSFELRGTSPEYNFKNVLKRILLKYKEIIGDDK